MGLDRYKGEFDAGTKVINTYLSGNSLRRIVSTTGSYAYLTKLGSYVSGRDRFYYDMDYEMTTYSDAACTKQYLETEKGTLNDSYGNSNTLTLGKVLNNGSYIDVPLGYYTKVKLIYRSYKYNNRTGSYVLSSEDEVVTYLYKKSGNISQIKISNFNENGIVDYYDKIGSDTNTGRTMTVTYSNMTDVKYQLGNNSCIR